MAFENKKLQFILDAVDKVTEPANKAKGALQAISRTVNETQKKITALQARTGDIKSFQEMQEGLKKAEAAINGMKAATVDALHAEDKAKAARTKANAEVRKAVTALDKATKAHGEHSEEVKKAKLHLDNVSKAADKAGKAFAKAKVETAAAKKAAADHASAVDKSRLAIERSEKALTEAGIDTRNLGSELKRVVQEEARHSTSLKNQQAQLDAATRKQDQLTKAKERYNKAMAVSAKLAITGGAMVMGGRAAIGGMMNPLQTGMEFNEQMSAVSAITRATPEQKAALKANAMRASQTSMFTATDAGKAQEYLGMAGFNADEIMASLSDAMKLAQATRTSLADTADISSNILKGMALEADQMKRVADVMANTTTSANVNLTELGESFKMAGPLFSTVGMQVEEAAAAIGLLGDVGIKGTQAGTHLRIALSRLAGPPKMAAKELEKLGMSADDLKKLEDGAKFTQQALSDMAIQTMDDMGNMRSLPDILRDVEKATASLGSAQKTAAYKKIFGAEAFVSMMALGKDVKSGAYDARTDANKGAEGRNDAVAAEMADNLAGDVKTYISHIEIMKIHTADVFDAIARTVVQTGTKVVAFVTEFIHSNPRLVKVLGLVSIAVAAVTVVLGALLLAVGAAIAVYAQLGVVIGKLIPLLRFLRLSTLMMAAASIRAAVAARAHTVAMAMGRVGMLAYAAACRVAGASSVLALGLIGAAILAVIAVIVLMVKHWEAIKAFGSGMWDGFLQGLQPILGFWNELLDSMGPVGDMFRWVGEKIGDLCNWFMKLFAPVEYTKEQLDGARTTGEQFGRALGLVFSAMTLPIRVFVGAIYTVCGILKRAYDAAYVFFSIDPMGSIREAFGAIPGYLESLLNGALEIAASAWGKILGLLGLDPMVTLEEAWGSVGDWFMTLGDTIYNAISGALDGAWAKVKEVGGGIIDFVKTGGGLWGDVAMPEAVKEAPPRGATAGTEARTKPAAKLQPKQQVQNFNTTVTPNITINAAPGMDEKAVGDAAAKAVRDYMLRAEQQNRGRTVDFG